MIQTFFVELQAPVGATSAPGTALDATAKGAAEEARAVTAEAEVGLRWLTHSQLELCGIQS